MRILAMKTSLILLSVMAFCGSALSGTSANPASAIAKRHHATTLPAALRPALYHALAKDAVSSLHVGQDGCVSLPKQKLKTCFDAYGAHFSGVGSLTLHLAAYGRSKLAAVKAVKPTIRNNRVSYAHGNLTAWWRVLPMGFEQGFTIAKPPAGHGELILALAANRQGADTPASRHSRESGNPVKNELTWGKLRYGKLVVTDAKGKVLPATLKYTGDRILIAVNDAHAAYPVTIDPLVWIEQKVTASDGAADDYFGSAVAISGDGKVALIGSAGKENGQGIAYIFMRTNQGWKQRAELAPGGGEANEAFGSALALSADGMTALVGAWNKTVHGNAEQGAAYVFTTSDNWTTHREAAELTASDGGFENDFGNGVALSADGTTALVGSPSGGHSGLGSAYVFTTTDDRATYTQSAELTPNYRVVGGGFGIGVALSAGGTTALVGAPGITVNGNPGQGEAYLFTLNNNSWNQVAELTANDGVSEDVFGNRMALSSDGATALISAIGKSNLQGAAYIFATSDGWATHMQTAELTASDGEQGDQFAYGVALSADGMTALVGSIGANVGVNIGQGKAYVYTDNGGAWIETASLTESDGAAYDSFATTVGISSNGATILMGSACHPYDPGAEPCGPGAAYLFSASDLSATLSAPGTVDANTKFDSKYILTNASATASAVVTVELAVPRANASYISSNTSQGSCNYDNSSQIAICTLGQIGGNGGNAWASLTLKSTGKAGDTIKQSANVAKAMPALKSSASTVIKKAEQPSPPPPPSGGGGGGRTGWQVLLALFGLALAGGCRKIRRG